jgi:hypothetical protein
VTIDNADALIQQAEDALSQGDRTKASHLYEAAAAVLSPTVERSEIGHLLLLAAGYERNDSVRGDKLYAEVQGIFEALGRQEKLSEVAMLRGTLARSAGLAEQAALYYTTAVRYAAQHIAELANGHLACGEPIRFVPEAEDALNRLAYCRDRLDELTGGS